MATTEWLLLRLPAQDDAPITWAAADNSGRLLSLPADEHDPGLRAATAGRRVALLVPAGDVSRFEVQLPAGNEARLLQLAPFALEDQVSEDVEDLHFAVGARDASKGTVPVAVANRDRMAQWLARATTLQLTPTALFAEGDLAPVLPGHVTMVITEEQLLLRQEQGAPQLLPAADPLLALEMFLGSMSELPGVNLLVFASPEDWPRHAAAIEALRERVATFSVQLESGGLLALYARGLARARPINLLQSTFRPTPSQQAGWGRWRGVAIALLALLLLQAVGSAWELHHLRSESAELDKAEAAVFTSVFPGQQPGAAPRQQFEQRLKEISSAPAERGELMPLLAALAAAEQNVPVATLDSFTFKPGSMQLHLSAPQADALEQFSQALRAGGYGAEILSGQRQGDNYAGQIQVKVAGS